MEHEVKLMIDNQLYGIENANTDQVCEECGLREICEEDTKFADSISFFCHYISKKNQCWKQSK